MLRCTRIPSESVCRTVSVTVEGTPLHCNWHRSTTSWMDFSDFETVIESRGNFKVPVVILINWYQLSESISSAQRRRYPHRLVGKNFGVSLYSLRWFITTEDEYHRLNKLFGCDFQETGLENVLLSLRWLREVLRTYYWSVYLASFDYCYKSSYLKFYLPEGREISILPLTIRNVTHKS